VVTRDLARHPKALVALLLTWLLAVTTGLAILWDYENAPGVSAAPPTRWPTDTRIVAAFDRPVLVMTVHPHCPCSRASLEELDRVMAHVPNRVAAYVLFVSPRDLPDDWTRTDLWQRAVGIHGVAVLRDDDGVEAQRFNAVTSGQTILYDANGSLLFSGGITGSRGHAGDNVGRSAIEALLMGHVAATRSTPVFGCSLVGTPERGDADHERRRGGRGEARALL
jgi:CBS domain-containing protein